MTIPVILYMLLTCITTIVVPWLGIIFYYILAVGQPEDMFPHHFGQDTRTSLIISLAVIVGLGVATATRQVDWTRLFFLPNILLMVVVVFFNLAIINSPFADFVDVKIAELTSSVMQETFNKIMLIYFIAVLLIDTRFKLLCLISVIGGVLLYYVLWANKIYFTGEFWRFGDNGRLNGPWGLYYDENYFAMLFVIAVPIFYYLSVGTTYRVIRYGLWLCIPLAWHALFLTGSRGALLALVVTMLYIFFRSYSKRVSVIFMVGLVLAIATQSGNMIKRITDTVSVEELERDRAFIENTDESPEIDKPVDPRLISWEVGLNIMKDYPLFGVGAANFMRAFPQYEDSEPHVAHNTFVQIGAASGVGAAMVYLYLLFLRLRNAVQKPDPEKKNPHGLKRDYLDDLLNSLFIGFYMVALFLDLMVIEVTYFIFLVGVCKYCLDNKKKHTIRSLIDSIYRWKESKEEGAPEKPAGPVVPVHRAAVPENQYGNGNSNQYAVDTNDTEPQDATVELPKNQYAPASLYVRQ